MQLYNPQILRWSTQIEHTQPLAPPFFSSEKHSRVCGSHISVQARIENNCITAISWQPGLCALGQAALGLLSGHILGLSYTEFTKLHQTMHTMIASGTGSFENKYEDFNILEIIHDHPSRHASVLLAFEAIEEIFLQAKRSKENGG